MAKSTTAMARARPLYQEITAEGYQIQTGAKSLRLEFINRAVKEIGLTVKGAPTYFSNLKNEAEGKPLYHVKKVAPKAERTFVDVSSIWGSAIKKG